MLHKNVRHGGIIGLLLVVGLGSGVPLLAAQGKIVVVEKKRFGNFRLYLLEVDREGAFYFRSFEEIVKLQPDGQRVFELKAKDHGLQRIADFRIAPDGNLLIVGPALETGGLYLATRVLVVSPKGQVRTSFVVPRLFAEIVEAGDRGEILLAGYTEGTTPGRLAPHLTISSVRSEG